MLLGENSLHAPDHHLLIVNNQDATAATGVRNGLGRCNYLVFPRVSRDRQRYTKHRPLPHFALDRQLPAHVGHDAMANGEAEPGADAYRFRRKECIEDPADDLRWDPCSGASDLDDDTLAREPGRHANLIVLRAALLHRLRGVHDEVEEHLPEACLVGVDAG